MIAIQFPMTRTISSQTATPNMSRAVLTIDSIRSVYTAADQDKFDTSYNDAKAIIDSMLVEKGMPDTLLSIIEKNIVLHFYTLYFELAKESLKSEENGEQSVAYYNTLGDSGFESTKFGSMAVSLDTSGTLKDMDNKKMNAISSSSKLPSFFMG